jgi:hypothetical protein
MHAAPEAAQISSHVLGVGVSRSGAVVKQDRPEPGTLAALPMVEVPSGSGAQERSTSEAKSKEKAGDFKERIKTSMRPCIRVICYSLQTKFVRTFMTATLFPRSVIE